MVSGYLTDPIMQAIILIDETCLDFDLFVGCQAAGGMEGDVVLTEDLLIQFAKNILTARHGKPCLVPSAWVWTWAGLAVSARFDRQSDIQTHDWIEWPTEVKQSDIYNRPKLQVTAFIRT